MGFLLLRPGAFRLLLAGLVLISHLSSFSTGRIGVILFFLLSGYWISDLWRRQGVYGARLFFINRFLRIWPLYIIAVLVAAALLGRNLHIWNFTIFGVASAPDIKPLGVEWSLDIEAQFYLLLPLLLTMRPSAWLIVPATLIGWTVVYYTGIHNVFMYIPAFFAGMLLYKYREVPLPASAMQALLAFCVLTGIFAVFPAGRAMLSNKIPDVMNEDIFAMIWAVPLVVYIGHSLRLRSGKFDRHLGNLSYPLYLVHEPIIQYVNPHSSVVKLGIIAGAILIAVLFYVVLDIPIENFRHALLKRLEARSIQNKEI
ncbi:acyltransferase family protein [Flavisphingomonas formosensis]|uniref:acyltransferase family protein n=1 Tax=Flavisphingomonas formosensis TaxID=861534 RepID=UPI0012F928A3|nr:acyltransferase [Sphingomonas formosensis]